MKEKLLNWISNLSAYLMVGITFVGAIIVYAGLETGNYYFVLIGLIVLIPSGIIFLASLFKLSKANKEDLNRIQDLIATGNKISVPLDHLDIKSNNYMHEVVEGSGTRSRNVQIKVNHNVIILKIPYEDDFINYRADINMETTKLKMHFAIKKETFLYVDKSNKHNLYLDLSFLD